MTYVGERCAYLAAIVFRRLEDAGAFVEAEGAVDIGPSFQHLQNLLSILLSL